MTKIVHYVPCRDEKGVEHHLMPGNYEIKSDGTVVGSNPPIKIINYEAGIKDGSIKEGKEAAI